MYFSFLAFIFNRGFTQTKTGRIVRRPDKFQSVGTLDPQKLSDRPTREQQPQTDTIDVSKEIIDRFEFY